jgi:hypothetical protein
MNICFKYDTAVCQQSIANCRRIYTATKIAENDGGGVFARQAAVQEQTT